MGWLRRWWRWLVAALAGLLAFFLIWKKRDERTPYFDEAEVRRRRLEAELARKQKEADEEYERKKAAIEKEQAEKRKAILADVVQGTDTIKDDPQKVNEYLKDIDEELRRSTTST